MCCRREVAPSLDIFAADGVRERSGHAVAMFAPPEIRWLRQQQRPRGRAEIVSDGSGRGVAHELAGEGEGLRVCVPRESWFFTFSKCAEVPERRRRLIIRDLAQQAPYR